MRRLLPSGLFGRLRVQMMLLLAFGLLTVDVVAYLGAAYNQDREVETTLDQASVRAAALPSAVPVVKVDLIRTMAPASLFVAYVDAGGNVLTSSNPVATDDVPDVATLQSTGSVTRSAPGGTAFRLRRIPVPQQVFLQQPDGWITGDVAFVVVGYPLAAMRQSLARLIVIELVCALAVLSAGFLLSGSFIRSGLRPLREISRTAEAIAGGRTAERVPVDENDSELRPVSAALNAAFDARQDSEDRMRDFVADASHELRTPLASVRGWADLYREGGIDDWDGVDVAMQNTWQEAGRMETLVEDMLTLARLDSAPASALVPVTLSSLLAETLASVALLHPDHHYLLELPSPAPTVYADPGTLHRAVTNLLVNAGRHTPAGSTVTVSVLRLPQTVEVRITDDGPGMTATQRAAAFDRFWRGDRSRARPGGTGLGLPISRSIARAAGGDLRLDAAEPIGLAAVITLPAPQ